MSSKKKLSLKKYFAEAEVDSREIFEAKQKIAIEKFGDIFEDEVFFALELELNSELEQELNREYNRRVFFNRKLN